MTMKLEGIPSDVLKDLRARGHTDAQIENMTANQAFDEWCTWHGLVLWGSTLRTVLADLRAAEDEAA